jgi:hypothetical protein
VTYKLVTHEAAEVPSKAHLIRRNGRWYFNRRFPKELWLITGEAFRLALRTDSLELAQRRRSDAERRYWAAVDEARGKLGETVARPLSDIETVGIVSRWFAERNRELDEGHLHQSTLPGGWQDAVAENEFSLAETTRRLGMNDIRGFAPLAERVLEAEGIKADPEGRGYANLLQLLVRANKELAAIDLARLRGDFGYRPTDPVMLAALEEKPVPKRTIFSLIEGYEADRSDKWSPSTKAAYGPVWRLLKDTLGVSRDVASLTREDGRLLFETVKGLPRGMGKVKALDGLGVPAAVQKAKQLGLPTVGPKTINGSYMGFLSSVFGWAVKEQWLTANPVAGLTVADTVDEADKRDPFSVVQLETIFGAAPWKPRDPSPRGKPLHFWGPLLALFHGMRRGEIAQMDIADVTVVDGVPVLLVRPGEDGQRIKTKASRRMVPLHPELQRMGFLAYAAEVRRSESKKLFPGETANGRGQWGDGLSDWFLRLLTSSKITGKRLGMHSFRHNFEDALRSAGLRGTDLGRELAGRSKGKGDSGESYGSGHSARELAEAIAKIAYSELDLSHLYLHQPASEPRG